MKKWANNQWINDWLKHKITESLILRKWKHRSVAVQYYLSMLFFLRYLFLSVYFLPHSRYTGQIKITIYTGNCSLTILIQNCFFKIMEKCLIPVIFFSINNYHVRQKLLTKSIKTKKILYCGQYVFIENVRK